jgi:hypothetical protein
VLHETCPSPALGYRSNLHRGLEIDLLVYPRRATRPGFGRNYDAGFDASVRICDAVTTADAQQSCVFCVPREHSFRSSGDARRASGVTLNC